MKKKYAFSLVETLCSLIVIAFLFGITSYNMSNFIPDYDKSKVKKASADIRSVAYLLLNNKTIYSGNDGFKNTDTLTLVENNISIGHGNTLGKFRDAFKYAITVSKDNIKCPVTKNFSFPDRCFQTDDGIVWNIPDTNFDSMGTVSADVDRIGTIKYTPILFYPNFKNTSTINDAYVIGIDASGHIIPLDIYNEQIQFYNCTTMCADDANEERKICKTYKYILSNTIKRDV